MEGRVERLWSRVGVVLTWARMHVVSMSLRRTVAVVVALSLWMGTGRMTAAVPPPEPTEEGFGAVHWYVG